MLLALVGGQCAGKDTIASLLCEDHTFTRAFLEYATLNWQGDFVTTDLVLVDDIEPFVKRPWFLAVAVEAGVIERWRRAVQRASTASSPAPALESFVAADDLAAYGPTPALPLATLSPQETRETKPPVHFFLPNGDSPAAPNFIPLSSDLAPTPQLETLTTPPAAFHASATDLRAVGPLRDLLRLTSYTILNTEPSLMHLRTSLTTTVAHLRTLLRPTWDSYFMTLARLASLRSNCMKRRVGAVLVTKRDKRVLSTGYNGTPRGMLNCSEGGCARCNGTLAGSSSSVGGLSSAAAAVAKCGVDLNECLCLHAEENALLEAGRERAGAGEGSTLYCNTCPCLRCSVKIVQCGVREVVYAMGYSMDSGTAAVFKEANVGLRQIPMPGS